MLIGRDRLVYRGLLGTPSQRLLGALAVYVSLRSPFRLVLGSGAPQHGDLAIVPSFVPHRISSRDTVIGAIYLEPEAIEPDALPPFLSQPGVVVEPPLLSRIREALSALDDPGVDARTVDIDRAFFGQVIPRRIVDARIGCVAERIKEQPCQALDADEAAALAGLSRSRFLHLFRSQLGTTFRRYRAWKRARAVLAYVSMQVNMSDLALEVGYSDATHFSHSMRSCYGLTPTDIFSGSRRLAVISQELV